MDAFIDDFRNTLERASKRLALISEEQSAVPSAVGKWSPKEIIGHLIDSAANNHARFVKAQLTEGLVFPGYEQNDWVAVQRYDEEPWEQLVTLWKYYNLHLLHVMVGASERSRQQPRDRHNLDRIAFQTIPTDQSTTLEYLMRDYVEHLRHHLGQVLGESP